MFNSEINIFKKFEGIIYFGKIQKNYILILWGLGIGDWGLGIGD